MEKYIPLLARIFLSAIFIKSGIEKILDPANTQDYMTAKGIPLAGVLLIPTIIVLVGGGLSVLLGYKARWGALLLIGFLIPATLIFHTDFPNQEVNFMKNIGLMGGLLMVVAFGAGELSLDRRNSSSVNH
ncbi:MAG TPA: DoxX family protein [Cyanobacteria bacterium UBA12227]|nr:DoxX family protein [Cyanobacteria bacterium UBA12227]HAX87782.1 DoxX family protein [Cyanobacteria bacterium UBA11370]HBY80197.1 DoxX family protein [Cyanobacteria bacterium UBA11148]